MPEKIGNISQADMAAKAGVTCKTLRAWRDDDGIDITDEEAVMARAAIKSRGGKPMDEDMAEIKKRHEYYKAELAAHKLEVERGKHVSHDDMLKDGQRAGMLVRTILQKMSGELTPRLAGKNSAEVEKELAKWSRDVLSNLANYDTLMEIRNERD